MATASPYKVHVRLGIAEFSAEGPEETVKKHLAEFFEAAPGYTSPSAQAKSQTSASVNENGMNSLTDGSGHAAAEDRSLEAIVPSFDPASNIWGDLMSRPSRESARATSERETVLDSALLHKIFKQNKDGVISLRSLPKVTEDTKADALFLILLGHMDLKEEADVMAADVIVGAKQSG